MINKKLIASKVKKLIAKNLSINLHTIRLNMSFKEDLGADSLDSLELLMDMETEFKLKIPDNEANKFRTVKHAVDYIKKHT